ncbi:hypothetical protein LH462_05590 [Laribacter hongkongensis]|uniref:hypothetical protein n=1 Tax=Laribacter hongkongensis TaxID=168471 RepID=UPI001EFDEDAC|nr:hypothetical protein [Laribacter hongkongensis]MCG8991060.1 hypothetical protein [Laribacter hongkongensis]MCG8997767.1 hypothetical protein [Laribacter hongkongensis]MCG9001071.1 hypothetical protein [Laribacter hongkongensis]MCG9004092.1 hypothetical protein [Laribacter hongkongensis]MCG9006112.1 hypothetical protein [Laribacter hongkongensis]
MYGVVKVIDALCGQGKTQRMICDMAGLPDDVNIIYITPLLSETHRIAGTEFSTKDDKKKPLKNGFGCYIYDENHPLHSKQFRHPESQQGDGKVGGLKYLIENNQNIVATHALFKMLTLEIVELLSSKNYCLFMDEVLDVWSVVEDDDLDLKKNELSRLIENDHVVLCDDGYTLKFNHGKFGNVSNTAYEKIAGLCDLEQLLMINKSAVWQMPPLALKNFKHIVVGTYLYEGSLLSAYFSHFGFSVEVERFGKKPSEIRHLISVVYNPDGRGKDSLNDIGLKRNSLSYTKITKDSDLQIELGKKLSNYYKGSSKSLSNIHKAKQQERLWTAPKKVYKKIGGNAFKASWLASTVKATNDYSDRWALAYLLEKNMKPAMFVLLSKINAKVDEDIYALSELVQWVWRSRIRKEQPVYIYIPSKRMRDLFEKWLDDGVGCS